MAIKYDRKIVTEDGQEYYGFGFGDTKVEAMCELLMNTAMVGYQEVISDPGYTDDMVLMTYPLIGNYGIAEEDFETKVPTIGGLIVREYNDSPSNFRYTKTLSEILEENDIPAIAGIDTRMLTRKIRDNGSCKVYICDADKPKDEALEYMRTHELPRDAVARVSCKKRWYSRTFKPKYNVVVVDCGTKLSVIKELNARGCNVTVVPYNTEARIIEGMDPDGIIISDGPGDPADVPVVIDLIKELKGKYPMFGISLGFELICMAYGAVCSKMKFGHGGGSHPVRNLINNRVDVVNQIHSYTVDPESLKNTKLTLTHKNVIEETVAGVECAEEKLFAVQFEVDNTVRPEGCENQYDMFVAMMKETKENA